MEQINQKYQLSITNELAESNSSYGKFCALCTWERKKSCKGANNIITPVLILNWIPKDTLIFPQHDDSDTTDE